MCLVVWPFDALTPEHLRWPLLTSAPSRPALLQVALCSWMTVLPISSTRSGQLASALWAFYAVSVRRLAHFHSGFLQTTPRGAALAIG